MAAATAPAMPAAMASVIARAATAFLATVEDGAPHLSLMRVTPVGEAILLLSTRRATRKYAAMVAQPRVAVLVTDAGESGDAIGALTMYGVARELAGEEEERCRALHHDRHPGYEVFTSGGDSALFMVAVESARAVDMRDVVTAWSCEAGGSSSKV